MSYSCKKSPTSDFQQCQAYNWEDSLTLWASNNDSKRYLQKALVKACRMYRVPIPTLHVLSKDKGKKGFMSSNYEPLTHTIRIRPRHRTLAVLLHEAAHAIVDWIVGPFSKAGHGKLWLGVFIELLDRFKVIPKHVSYYSAKHANLKWAPHASPSHIRKYRPKMVKDAHKWRRVMKLWT